MSKIRLRWDKSRLDAELLDTPSAHALLKALPVESTANTWGDEVYFKIPIAAKLEPNATDVVDPGTVCFWVQGSSLALPFGPTPVSKGNECRLVTQVNILGKFLGDAQLLKTVKEGMRMRVERVTDADAGQ